MAFTLPNFNLSVDIWRAGLNPATDPPSLTVMANLAWGRRGASPSTGGTGSAGVVTLAEILLLPALTDVRSDEKCGGGDDSVEAPSGTGRIYKVIYVDDIGKGFANEHRGCILKAVTGWPAPIP